MKKQFNALVIDDERLSRKELITMLSEFNNINIVGEAENVEEAVVKISTLNPDVLFLDIQMPGQTGFDLLNRITNDLEVIFITAFDEFALRAFEINALDYLLKPINPERLRNSIERLTSGAYKKDIVNNKLNNDDRLFLSVNSHLRFIKVSSIIVINSAGDYSEIHTGDGIKGLTSKSMNEWESRLPENYFCRIHRSTIINLDKIDKMEEWFNNSIKVYLKGIDSPQVISRRFVSKIKEKFS